MQDVYKRQAYTGTESNPPAVIIAASNVARILFPLIVIPSSLLISSFVASIPLSNFLFLLYKNYFGINSPIAVYTKSTANGIHIHEKDRIKIPVFLYIL